jgi:hypothetical protein
MASRHDLLPLIDSVEMGHCTCAMMTKIRQLPDKIYRQTQNLIDSFLYTGKALVNGNELTTGTRLKS